MKAFVSLAIAVALIGASAAYAQFPPGGAGGPGRFGPGGAGGGPGSFGPGGAGAPGFNPGGIPSGPGNPGATPGFPGGTPGFPGGTPGSTSGGFGPGSNPGGFPGGTVPGGFNPGSPQGGSQFPGSGIPDAGSGAGGSQFPNSGPPGGSGFDSGFGRMQQPDVPQFQWVEEKICTSCNKRVSSDAKVGDRCPHCGVLWTTDETAPFGSSTSTPTSSSSSGSWRLGRGVFKLIGLVVFGLVAAVGGVIALLKKLLTPKPMPTQFGPQQFGPQQFGQAPWQRRQ